MNGNWSDNAWDDDEDDHGHAESMLDALDFSHPPSPTTSTLAWTRYSRTTMGNLGPRPFSSQ